MEHARLISIAQKVIHKFGKDRQLTLCCAVYSRARTKQGCGVIREIRYLLFRLQIVERSSLVSVPFREAFSHPYISFFHLLVNGFSVII